MKAKRIYGYGKPNFMSKVGKFLNKKDNDFLSLDSSLFMASAKYQSKRGLLKWNVQNVEYC